VLEVLPRTVSRLDPRAEHPGMDSLRVRVGDARAPGRPVRDSVIDRAGSHVPTKALVTTKDHDRPENQRRYRYWVEIRDLRDGSVRTLPLHALRLVHLSRKRGEPPQPDEQLLRLQDDSTVIEAKNLRTLAKQLRNRYPDETHERRLHWERDLEAEQRYADALDSLTELLVEAAVNDVLSEQGTGCRDPAGKKDPPQKSSRVRRSRPRRTSQSRS